MLLLNAFSLNMISDYPLSFAVERVPAWMVSEDPELTSAIGHADTAAVLSTLLGREVPCARTTVKLTDGSKVWVAQYVGPRLPEGATTLPEGAKIEFLKVSVFADY